MFLIRRGGAGDFDGVFRLARLLDSYNLPADRGVIRRLLRCSEDSFAGRLPRSEARYLLVLEKRGAIVGCSLIIAKHGTRRRPHLWLGLEKVVKRSRTLGLTRSHPVLRLGHTEDGPTEVGGLVVLPAYRKNPACCGLQISYARFLYMGIHPDRFERQVLVEYRGVIGRGNRSPFWDALGRVFTGLPYPMADRLSISNKEFVLSLFPREPIYCALLPASARAAIGAIHPASRRAAALLRGLGFRPLPQIEPFDGGPYYSAGLREIRLIRNLRRLEAAVIRPGTFDPRRGRAPSGWYLAGTDAGGFFRAARIAGRIAGDRCMMEEESLRLLNVREGQEIHVCPVSR